MLMDAKFDLSLEEFEEDVRDPTVKSLSYKMCKDYTKSVFKIKNAIH